MTLNLLSETENKNQINAINATDSLTVRSTPSIYKHKPRVLNTDILLITKYHHAFSLEVLFSPN